MEEYTDETLINLLRSAVKVERNKGLTVLYQTLYGSIARFILNNSGTEEDAKDIFQEGLLVLFEKVVEPDFEQKSTLKTFLHAICRNLWFKRLRKGNHKVESIEGLSLLLATETEEDDGEEQKLLLRQLLKEVGDSCRQVLLLFYFERKNMKEIAEILDLSNDQVAKNKKTRCMKKLRELYVQMRGFKEKSN